MKVNKTKVLFIALEFAPLQQAGAFRSIAFAKYLPKYGIEPIVVTIDPCDAKKIFGSPINNNLLNDFDSRPSIYYLRDSKPIYCESKIKRALRLLFKFNDSFHKRFKASLSKLLPTILAAHDVSAVYVSLPPFGAGRLAMDVVQKTGLPLIVDMRDAWSQWASSPFPTYVHYWKTLQNEKKLLSKADAIVTVTPELSQMFKTSHPLIEESRFHVIPNGIDKTDVEERGCTWGDDRSKIKIAYVGSYYYEPLGESSRAKRWFQRSPHRWLHYFPVSQYWLYRTPFFFFSALAKLREIDPLAASRFEFHQIGSTPGWLLEMTDKFGLSEQVKLHDLVPREEVVSTLDQMDACLVTSIKVEGGDDYCLASKTFDYIHANKLMLGFVADGAQKRFLQAVGGSLICNAEDIKINAQVLLGLSNKAVSYHYSQTEIHNYSRQRSAASLSSLLVSCVD